LAADNAALYQLDFRALPLSISHTQSAAKRRDVRSPHGHRNPWWRYTRYLIALRIHTALLRLSSGPTVCQFQEEYKNGRYGNEREEKRQTPPPRESAKGVKRGDCRERGIPPAAAAPRAGPTGQSLTLSTSSVHGHFGTAPPGIPNWGRHIPISGDVHNADDGLAACNTRDATGGAGPLRRVLDSSQ
jgi:hypothetical protein